MKIKKIEISEYVREMDRNGNHPALNAEIMLADKINEIIEYINSKDNQLL